MNASLPKTGLTLRSLITEDGRLEVSLRKEALPTPGENDVLVRVEAAPINPSDLGLLLGAGDLEALSVRGSGDETVLSAPVSPAGLKAMGPRVGKSMPVGNEGAGVVVSAGASKEAQALLGKTVAVLGGGMYAQYRVVPFDACLAVAEGTRPEAAASAFVNPLTVLGMVETMRTEGHHALVHNAAASSLGQMLIRVCAKDGIELVNIVRKDEHVALLKGLGAKHVVNSTSETFVSELTEALVQTGATLAFDAAGGGKVAGQILAAMEAALSRDARRYSPYGSTTHKQVYLYGGLDPSPTELRRSYGMAWGIGGWLVFPFLQKVGAPRTAELKARVAAELETTFATTYTKQVSLVEVLQPGEVATYAQRATGQKYLITPQRTF